MAEVALIAPADRSPLRERLGFKAPPLNLLYLASSARESGFSVRVIDDNVHRSGAEAVSRSLNGDVKFVGLTAATSTLNAAFEYANEIKRQHEDATIVFGGPHVTFLAEETMRGCGSIDAAVLGEGEDAFSELMSTAERGGDLAGVKGIAWRQDGAVRVNGPREQRRDIDSYPLPARDLIDLRDYSDPVKKRPIGTMITSRGCVFGCNYCASSRMMGRRFRARSPSSIVDEMERLGELGAEDIEFIDDIFVLNERRAAEVAHEITRRGLDVNFSASSRVDTLPRSLLNELKEAGLTSIYLGIESGSQRVLDLMGKGTTVEQARDAVRAAKELGVKVLGSFILGYPGETVEEMDDTIRLALRLGIDFAQFSLLTPFPGTPIFDELRADGLLSTEDYSRFTAVEPVIDYDRMGVGRKAVVRKLAKAYVSFYLRPSYVLRHPYMLSMIPHALFPRSDRSRA